jgi:hypothetical protein
MSPARFRCATQLIIEVSWVMKKYVRTGVECGGAAQKKGLQASWPHALALKPGVSGRKFRSLSQSSR